MSRHINADLLILRLEIEKVRAQALTFSQTNNLGCCVQSLEAALYWLDREINPPKEVA